MAGKPLVVLGAVVEAGQVANRPQPLAIVADGLVHLFERQASGVDGVDDQQRIDDEPIVSGLADDRQDLLGQVAVTEVEGGEGLDAISETLL